MLDARLGRWLSPDPIVKPWESVYAGFANNPVYYTDPSGLDAVNDGNGPGGNNEDKNKGTITVTMEEYELDKEGKNISIEIIVTINGGKSPGTSSNSEKKPQENKTTPNEEDEYGGEKSNIFVYDRNISHHSGRNSDVGKEGESWYNPNWTMGNSRHKVGKGSHTHYSGVETVSKENHSSSASSGIYTDAKDVKSEAEGILPGAVSGAVNVETVSKAKQIADAIDKTIEQYHRGKEEPVDTQTQLKKRYGLDKVFLYPGSNEGDFEKGNFSGERKIVKSKNVFIHRINYENFKALGDSLVYLKNSSGYELQK